MAVEGDKAYTVREVVNGKVASVSCTDLDMLATYLRRAFNDPKGPKSLRLRVQGSTLRPPEAGVRGLRRGRVREGVVQPRRAAVHSPRGEAGTPPRTRGVILNEVYLEPEAAPKPGEIDLKQYVPKK